MFYCGKGITDGYVNLRIDYLTFITDNRPKDHDNADGKSRKRINL